MVVTGSRLHAVRYKQEFDRQIKEHGYRDVRTLVAFSGTVEDPDAKDVTYTEPGMNLDCVNGKPIKEKELPQRFDSPEYHLLIVAEKYQTGFDQPLLHTMFVDKRLAGIQAVQTLSRLNRTCTGKEDTFVLDFANKREEILEAFQPYYEQTGVGEQADSSQLYPLYDEILDRQIIYREDIDKLCQAFFIDPKRYAKGGHAKLYVYTGPAARRFAELDEDQREEFRGKLHAYRSLYGFLSQIIPFQDSDLEKLYTYLRFLMPQLVKPDRGPTYNFDDEVTLQFYRLQKISEGAITLEKGERGELDGPTAVGTGANNRPEIELSKLIDLLNERFGTEFKPADQLFFDQISAEAMEDETLQQAAHANALDAFGYVFDKAVEGLFIDRLDQNEELTARYMNDAEFQQVVNAHLRREVYERIRAQATSG
jgi:type I restriction enzyme R subunit